MNARKTIIATLFAAAFVAPLAVAPVQAQIHAQATRSYTQAELDQMLAPIALYPDALLSQVLMAATYPIEVVEAARWTRANPNLQGDAAVRAVENQDWDPSVKSLVAFPQILQRMDEQLNWTESLGDAFLAQEPQVMDSVQHLRRRAQAAGHLQSSEQIYVQQQGPTILIQPASPQYVYVPYYDPLVVYGTWWWPAYRPVHWAPWPGYARPYYRSGVSAGFWWGQPVGLSLNFFFGNVDWHRRHVHVAHPRAYYYRAPVFVNRTVVDRGRWQHDPHHRRGVDYRAAEVRQRFAAAQFERRDGRPEQRQDQREVRSPWQRQDAQPQARPERREAREEQQRPRSDAGSVERAQQRQQREQAQAAERAQRDKRDQQAEAARAQQQQLRQQAETARAQQQQQQRQQAEVARAQQRQQAEAARAQQQQQRHEQQRAAMPAAKALQTPRAERHEQREERREGRHEQRQERGQKG
jgi:DNA segregation ATPase FtsK/SpoIIIE-like protein